jgi:hypothetical protein
VVDGTVVVVVRTCWLTPTGMPPMYIKFLNPWKASPTLSLFRELFAGSQRASSEWLALGTSPSLSERLWIRTQTRVAPARIW